jgi:hypothetical protein
MRNNEERFGANMNRQDATTPQILQQQENSPTPLNFIVPTELVALPSGGRFYPPHHPLHGKDTIEIKQMTAKEEDILTSKTLIKKGVALDKLIQSLVVDKSINTDTLTIDDRSAILVAARISAYGNDYTTGVICPSCENKTIFKFDLLEHIAKESSELPDIIYNPDGTFNMVLPTTKWNVKCRALTGYDEKAFIRTSDNKTINKYDSMLLQQLRSIVIEVQGSNNVEFVANALEVLPAKDSRYIRVTYEKIVTPMNLIKSFTCSNCDNSAQVEVPLSADFFWFK